MDDLKKLADLSDEQLVAKLNTREHMRARYVLFRFERLKGEPAHVDPTVAKWLQWSGLCHLIDHGEEKNRDGSPLHHVLQISDRGKRLLPKLEQNFSKSVGV